MNTLTLDHVIYAPTPYKGYTFRAKSRGADVEAVREAFKDWLVPFQQTMITSNFLERIIVIRRGKAYFARVFQAPALDELKRSGIVSHIAELTLSLFKEIPLSLVDSAMASFIAERGIQIGNLEPLTVALMHDKDLEHEFIRKTIPTEIAEKIAEACKSEKFRLFIVYKGSEKETLVYGLARKLLTELFHGDLIIASERIRSDVLLLYDGVLIVGSRLPPWAKSKVWSVINLEKYAPSASRSTQVVDEVLKRIYGEQP